MPINLRHTPRRPWRPMTDAGWQALLPYLRHRSPAGRPLPELRTRMDAIFRMVAARKPWHELPEKYGKPDTVARYFRRLTHVGLWQKLLTDLAQAHPKSPLRRIEWFICWACRRAKRMLGVGIIVLLRRLQVTLQTAFWAPPWLLPHPDLGAAWLARMPMATRIDYQDPDGVARFRDSSRRILDALRCSLGQARIPRGLQDMWQ